MDTNQTSLLCLLRDMERLLLSTDISLNEGNDETLKCGYFIYVSLMMAEMAKLYAKEGHNGEDACNTLESMMKELSELTYKYTNHEIRRYLPNGDVVPN